MEGERGELRRDRGLLHACALGLLPSVAVYLGLRLAGVELFWVAVGAYHGLCVVVPALHPARSAELRSSRWTGPSVVIAGLLAAAIWALGRELHARGWLVPRDAHALLLRLEPWRFFAVYSLAVNGFLEERFWRGFLLPRSGLVVGALLFGLMHFAGLVAVLAPLDAALLSLPAVIAGFAWGWTRRASGSLWPCVITHVGADAGVLALLQSIRAS